MKLYSIFLYLILCSSCMAQTYHFDVVTIYQRNHPDDKSKSVVFGSRTDPSYTMVLSAWSTPRAYLYDKTTNQNYIFDVIYTNESAFKDFKFNLIESYTYNNKRDLKFYNVKLSATDNDSVVMVETSVKHLHPKSSKAVRIKKSDGDLFPLFQCACLHPFERMIVQTPFNFLVTVANNGKYDYCKLIDIQEIDFDLSIQK